VENQVPEVDNFCDCPLCEAETKEHYYQDHNHKNCTKCGFPDSKAYLVDGLCKDCYRKICDKNCKKCVMPACPDDKLGLNCPICGSYGISGWNTIDDCDDGYTERLLCHDCHNYRDITWELVSGNSAEECPKCKNHNIKYMEVYEKNTGLNTFSHLCEKCKVEYESVYRLVSVKTDLHDSLTELIKTGRELCLLNNTEELIFMDTRFDIRRTVRRDGIVMFSVFPNKFWNGKKYDSKFQYNQAFRLENGCWIPVSFGFDTRVKLMELEDEILGYWEEFDKKIISIEYSRYFLTTKFLSDTQLQCWVWDGPACQDEDLVYETVFDLKKVFIERLQSWSLCEAIDGQWMVRGEYVKLLSCYLFKDFNGEITRKSRNEGDNYLESYRTEDGKAILWSKYSQEDIKNRYSIGYVFCQDKSGIPLVTFGQTEGVPCLIFDEGKPWILKPKDIMRIEEIVAARVHRAGYNS
jgi:hypothetical protein